MNPPNKKTATIGDMVTWTSQANGKIKRGAKYHLINAILMDIENLQALACVPWVSRKWALPAWREIKKIGILDGLELLPMQAPRPPDEPRFPIARIRQLCEKLGLGFNRINGRIVITRKTYTEKSETNCQADL